MSTWRIARLIAAKDLRIELRSRVVTNQVLPFAAMVDMSLAREALKRMPAGSTWEVVIPPTLAYGARGNDNLGPNETLVFVVDLVAVR